MKISYKVYLVLFFLFNVSLLTLLSCKDGSKTNAPATTTNKVAEPVQVSDLKQMDPNIKGAMRCQQCHENAVKDWIGSDHDMAMKRATEETVVADFNNTEFVHKGITSKFYKKDGDFYAYTQNGQGEMEEFKITHTFGFTPLQQYIVDFPNGKKQCLHIAWDVENKKWYHLYGDMDIDPKEWLHWSHGSQNWNSMCADCHSTELKKNYDAEKDQYHTTFKEMNVSCEACHGPSEEHILAKLNPEKSLSNGELFVGLTKDKTPINKTEINKCARCHSRRAQITDYYDHTGEFMDHYLPEILRDNLYHGDGQILDEVYVYGSFTQSKMYHHNVRCSDCHNPHSNKLKFEGNALCMQCHGNMPGKVFDSPAHHFHAEGTPGALCINCHMPGKLYMGVDFRRDHSFRLPRPDQTVKYGTPNACNGCHTDKTPEWAAEEVAKRFGPNRPPHYSEILAMARDPKFNRPEFLIALARDTTQPAIARATAIWMLQGFPDQSSFACAADMLKDKEPLVRFQSMSMFNGLPKNQRSTLISNMLLDNVRAIRVEAANILSDFQADELEEVYKRPFALALEEYTKYMRLNADSAAGQLNLGNFYNRRNEPKKAADSFQRAIDIDSHFNMARINLAFILSMDQKYDEAEKLYLKVLEQEPNYSNAWYSLGLLYSEQSKFDKAEVAFDKAILRSPENIRIYYNRALCLQKLGRYSDAEKAFISGLNNFPYDRRTQYFVETLYALIILQLDMGNKEEAMKNADKLAELVGKNHQFMQFIAEKMQGQ